MNDHPKPNIADDRGRQSTSPWRMPLAGWKDVAVRTWRNDALAGQPEHARRRGGARLDPTLEREFASDDALVQQLHAVLDAADAVGDRREIAKAQFFLVLHAERAVVGGDHRQLVHSQSLPEVAMVMLVLRSQRRGAHPLRALEPRLGEMVLDRQVQVLRACLGEYVLALVASFGDLFECL